MGARLASCDSCGTNLLWLPSLDSRPLEATPCPRRIGEHGYVVVRRNGHRVWEPSVDHPNAPSHLRVHICYLELAQAHRSVPDPLAPLGFLDDLTIRSEGT